MFYYLTLNLVVSKLDLPPTIYNYFATSRLSCLYLLPVSILAICTIIILLRLNCLCLSRRTVLNQCSMLNHIHVPDSIHYVFMTNHLIASSLLGLIAIRYLDQLSASLQYQYPLNERGLQG